MHDLIADQVQVTLTFVVAIATSSGNDGMITVNLQDYRHNADNPFMAGVVDHTLSSFLQPANGNWFVQNACLDLRAALMAAYSDQETKVTHGNGLRGGAI